MMHRKTGFFGLMVIVFMCLMVGGVSAQGDFTDEETEWIDVVAQAFEDTLDVDSYSAEIEQHLVQEISVGNQEANNELSQSIELEVENTDDGLQFSAVIDQDLTVDSGGQSTEVEMTLELIQIDGEFFARASDLSPRALNTSFPEDWLNVTEDGDRYPFVNAMNLGSPELLYNSPLILEISEDSVLAIEEQDGDEIAGADMRVFEIGYNAEVMLESDAMSSIVDSMADLLAGVDVEDLIQQMADGSEMDLTVWIGEDDGLIYRIDSVFNIDADLSVSGTELGFVQEGETTVTFDDFGEDMDIEAPDL